MSVIYINGHIVIYTYIYIFFIKTIINIMTGNTHVQIMEVLTTFTNFQQLTHSLVSAGVSVL